MWEHLVHSFPIMKMFQSSFDCSANDPAGIYHRDKNLHNQKSSKNIVQFHPLHTKIMSTLLFPRPHPVSSTYDQSISPQKTQHLNVNPPCSGCFFFRGGSRSLLLFKFLPQISRARQLAASLPLSVC